MRYFLEFLFLFILLKNIDHVTFALQIPSRQASRPSIIATSNISAASSSIQAYNSSSASASKSLIIDGINATAGATAASPTPVSSNAKHAGGYNATENYQGIQSDNCPVTDSYCSLTGNNGTVGKANGTSIDNLCVLWDPSCSGNATSATDTFFGRTFQHDLLSNRCFVLAGSVNVGNASQCDRYNPPGRMSELQSLKNWMRSQQCASAATKWALNESPLDPASQQAIVLDPLQYHITQGATGGANGSCCGTCATSAQNVEIYYWPEPDTNTSCLSIIGDDVKPIDFGATKSTWSVGTITTTDTFWGCHTKASTYTDAFSRIVTGDYPIRTAVITTIGPLKVKVYLSDPWSSSPCTGSDAMSLSLDKPATLRARHAPMHLRGYTLIAPSSVTLKDNLPVTTIVSGSFTFTSPSIYANFHGIEATDQCGGVAISSTMIGFAPGELSTIAGPLASGQGGGPSAFAAKSFNFKDLPCPPQSVMEGNWYKPEPGEPYRPLIALPAKLQKMVPWLSHCANNFFTAYDPPTALTPEAALAGPSSPNDPQAPSSASVSMSTLDTAASQTGAPVASVPVPVDVPVLNQPTATDTAASAATKQAGPDPERQSNIPTVQESPPAQPSPTEPATSGDPKAVINPQQINDPDQGSSNNGPSGQEEDPQLNNNPNQVNNSQESSENTDGVPPNDPNQVNSSQESIENTDGVPPNDPNQVNNSQESNKNTDGVPQNDPQQTNEVNPFKSYTEDRATTINDLVIQPLSSGISIAGTILTPGASPITVSGTPIQYGSSALVIGTSTVHLAPEVPAIIGQGITETPSPAIAAGTNLAPGASGMALAGILMPLDTASQVIIDSKTISVEPVSQSSIVTDIGGQVIVAAHTRTSIAGAFQPLDVSNVVMGNTPISLNTAGQSIVGSKTVALQNGESGIGGLIVGGFGAGGPSEVDGLVVATVNGQVITVGPTAALATAAAVATLTPGDLGVTIDGVVVSLKMADELVVGSKTISLDEKKSANTSGLSAATAASVAGSIVGTSGSGLGTAYGNGNLSTNLPTSTSLLNETSTGAAGSKTQATSHTSQGNAMRTLRGRFVWRDVIILAIVTFFLGYMY